MSLAQVTLSLLSGFKITLLIFFITLALSLPLGLLITFGSMSKFSPLKYIVKAFVWIIRGTPLMLQVIVVFYVPGLLFQHIAKTYSGIPFPLWLTYLQSFAAWIAKNRVGAVIVAFVVNYSAYFSEIYRGGIESIPKGQYEAGQVLGMTKSQIFQKVILMQVIKRVIPPMGNEIITLVKDTSLARIIAVPEIIMAAQNFASSKALIWPLFYTGVFYLLFNGILTILFGRIEKKMNYYSA